MFKEIDEYMDLLKVSELFGDYHIFKSPRIIVPSSTDLPMYVANTEELNIEELVHIIVGEFKFIPHSGKGTTPNKALGSGLGEAVERTIPIIKRPRAEVYGTYGDLKSNALGPQQLPLFALEQYESIPFNQFTEQTYIGWVRMHDIINSEQILAPGQIMAFGYIPVATEKLIGYSSSDGLAVHTDIDKAIYKGAIEFIERDAVNLGWHSDIPPYKVELDLKEALDILGLDTKIPYNDIKLDVFLWRSDTDVYVVSTHVIDKRRKFYTYFPGEGAGTTFVEALSKALAESCQAYFHSYAIHRYRRDFGEDADYYYVDENSSPEEADNLFRIVFYYGYPSNLQKLYREFFSRSPRYDLKNFERNEEITRFSHRYSILRTIAKEKRLTLLQLNQTPEELEHLNIVRVFIPELTQYNAPRYPYFGHFRYYLARRILKIDDITLNYKDLRKIPIPYP
ncbi:MAG: YcaO-like family protein [Ignisphaera sp.]